jgi:hypothetical protein
VDARDGVSAVRAIASPPPRSMRGGVPRRAK